MQTLKIIFCGTPEFAVPILSALADDPRVEIKQVVTMPDRPASRGQQLTAPPVAQEAKKRGLPLFQTANLNQESAWIAQQRQNQIDAIIVAAFAQFLKEELLSLGRLGAFNFHGSLLPKYRGAAPIQYALLNNDATTGISIQKMVLKMDAGDIAAQSSVPITEEDNYLTLTAKLQQQAVKILPDFITHLINDDLILQPQDTTKVSYAPTIKKEMGFLDFAQQSSASILGQIKAFALWPKTYCFINHNRLLVHEAQIFSQTTLAPGEIATNSGYLLIGTTTQTLRLSLIQWANKKAVADTAWLQGVHQTLHLTGRPA
ncbi:MAG: methionyl-tRNA formyltransferase [Bacteriovoracaceae bacterium]|nr:methionyl-tRNA formyltransferase [Bacteriovoracaceae bacterium]